MLLKLTSVSIFKLLKEPQEAEEGLEVDAKAGTFRLDGVTFRPGDTVFVLPDTFDQCTAAVEDTRNAVPDFAAKSRHVKVLCAVLCRVEAARR